MAKRISKLIRLIPAALLLLLADGVGQASYLQLTSVSQLNPSDVVAAYAQPDSTKVGSPFIEVIGGNSVTFSTSSNSPFTVQQQGVSFFGNFASGTPVLYNGGGGPDLISFAVPVSEFGVTVESDVIAPHGYTVSFLSGSSTDLTYSVSDEVFSTVFVGAQGTSSSSFDHVVIGSDDNDFAIGPVSLSRSITATPEPSSWLLWGTGAMLLSFLRSRTRA